MIGKPSGLLISWVSALSCMVLLACGGSGGGVQSNNPPQNSPDNQAPTAVIASPGIQELNVSLDASQSTDPQGEDLICAWDFGDGNTGSGAQVNHLYAAAGSYQVTLTVTDQASNSDQAVLTIVVSVSDSPPPPSTDFECDNWQTRHPEWIFCDDFENSAPLLGDGRYFEYKDNDGEFVVVDGAGTRESRGMRALWQRGEVGAGNLKLAFGRIPSSYMDKGIRNTENFTEIYYRMYLKMQSGWQGSDPAKLSRATIIADDNWSQAMIAHIWSGNPNLLAIDPVRCVDADDRFMCHGYNDFDNMDWIGLQDGNTPVFAPTHNDRWFCIEAHVKLNEGDQDNGIQEFWIDGNLEARKADLNFVRGYTDYGINAIFFENWWNAGSPQEQERYMDNFVVSTQPIGCLDPAP